ncbi:MAG TPA: type II 3-dehydroquinate dehydratase [Candidatus Dormibacteraeota bacterium]|nr:type II 3-dehydroquinate dehydratase [Candidatus Dormibacteraeota bacterium]
MSGPIEGPPPRFLCLNGPNLGALGRREPALYGRTTLAELEARLRARATELGVSVDCRQSNHEGQLIDWLEEAGDALGAICNPGGLAHSSVALRDAITTFGRPVVEVHLTNVHAREPFRQRLVTAGAARALISGLGADGYLLALEALLGLTGPSRGTS